jgi:hypothetical protein
MTVTNTTIIGNEAVGGYGVAPGGSGIGGGIYNDGVATLIDSAVLENTTRSSLTTGGGIENSVSGTLIISRTPSQAL